MSQLKKHQRLEAYRTVLLVYLSFDRLKPESLYDHFKAYFEINHPTLFVSNFILEEEFPEFIDFDTNGDQFKKPAFDNDGRRRRIALLRYSIKELDNTYTPRKSLKGTGVYLLSFTVTYLLFCLIFLYYTDDYLEILRTEQVAQFYTLYIGWWISLLPTLVFWKKKRV
jgi:hypothetical protein